MSGSLESGVRLVALGAFAAGLLDISLALSGDISDRPFPLLLDIPSHWSKSLIIACGLTLMYLAVNLARRKRIAWIFASVISGLSIAFHLLHRDVGAGLLGVVLFFIMLLVLRDRFPVRSEPTSIASGFALSGTILAISILYGAAGFWFMDRRDFGIDFNLIDSIARTLREFLLIGNKDLVPQTHHASWFLHSLNIAGATTGVLVAHSFFRPLNYVFNTKPQEIQKAGELLKQYGRSSMDYYKLMPEKAYYFSPSGKSFIAYAMEHDVAVCLGDPVGPLDDLKETIESFHSWTSVNGWLVCFVQTETDSKDTFTQLGFTVIKIGEEARIELEKFTTVTSKKKHFKKESKFKGYELVRHEPPHANELIDAVEEVSNQWLSLPGRGEHEFTLGKFDRDYLMTTPIFTLMNPDREIIAFVNEVPSYCKDEVSIDLMRHKEAVPSGTMDFLFLRLLQYYNEKRYKYFNLGLAALAGVGESPDASFQERALHQLYEHLNRFFSYKGLRNYKQKFDPIWESRYFVYAGGPANLLKCVLAFKKVTGY